MKFTGHSSGPIRPLFGLTWCLALARGVALFLGCFSLLNLVGGIRSPGFDANLWWIDLRALPPWFAQVALGGAAVLLLAYGFRPSPRKWRRRLTMGAVGFLGLVALGNAAMFYGIVWRGEIHAAVPVPLSLIVVAALLLVGRGLSQPASVSAASGVRAAVPVGAVFFACMVLFPLAQEFCFGKTDYRRRADAVVVFGARAYADGTPSDALADRVRTGCQLYRDGFARKLIFSGGPGDAEVHETEAMRRMALSLGVRDEDILLDSSGWNTRATVRNTTAMFERHGLRRILAVSHFYHLPRIKLEYARAGVEVRTVPARESYFLRQTPLSVLREVPALWVYYLKPLLSGESRTGLPQSRMLARHVEDSVQAMVP